MKYSLYHPQHGWAFVSVRHKTIRFETSPVQITTQRWLLEEIQKQAFYFQGSTLDAEDLQIKEIP
jgi:hypothetical protein